MIEAVATARRTTVDTLRTARTRVRTAVRRRLRRDEQPQQAEKASGAQEMLQREGNKIFALRDELLAYPQVVREDTGWVVIPELGIEVMDCPSNLFPGHNELKIYRTTPDGTGRTAMTNLTVRYDPDEDGKVVQINLLSSEITGEHLRQNPTPQGVRLNYAESVLKQDGARGSLSNSYGNRGATTILLEVNPDPSEYALEKLREFDERVEKAIARAKTPVRQTV